MDTRTLLGYVRDKMNSPTVIYEDADIVVIDKPAGLMTHPDGRTSEATLVDWIRTAYPEMEGVGEPLDLEDEASVARPGIVHRLDQDTSGVLVLARTKQAHAFLKRQFMDRLVRKTYRAFVYGNLREDRGTIDRPIGKSRSDFRQWSARRDSRGELRDAITEFKTLARGGGATYVEVFPKTGRTHQIRVHFRALQHPVLCDSLYARGKGPLLGFERLALHAKNIRFTLPSGEEAFFEAPLPSDFLEAERQIKEAA